MIRRRGFAIGLLLVAAGGAAGFPVARIPVALIAAAVAVAVAWRPPLVYAAAALATPALDLTPWSGRCFFNEFDIWLLAALGGAFWSTELSRRRPPSRVDAVLIAGLLLSYGASVLVALASPTGADGGTVYASPLNAVRTARALLYVGMLGVLFWRSGISPSKVLGAYAAGTAAGLLGAVVTVGVERLRFCGLVDLTSDFRVTGPFGDMHTGGAHLDAYLVTALPLLICAWRRAAAWWGRASLLAVMLGGVYAACVTLSRTPLVIIALQSVVLAVVATRLRGRQSTRRAWSAVAAAVLILAALGAASLAPALQKRFFSVAADSQIRLEHWRRSLAAPSDGWTTRLLGVGCGGYPRMLRRAADESPGGYSLHREGDEAFLRVVGPPLVYFDQRVPLAPDTTYTIALRGRRRSEQGYLTVTLVEKNLLYAYESVSHSSLLADSPRGEWTEVRRKINTGPVGRPRDRTPLPAVSRPVALSLFASPGGVFDIDRLELLDPSGDNLIANHDFRSGHDRWWWTSDKHLEWHAKNLAVHLLVEQGWLGLLAFSAMAARCLWLLGRAVGEGDGDAAPVACGLVGLLLMGVIDSVIDSPRTLLLVCLVMGYAFSLGRLGSPAIGPDDRALSRGTETA